MDNIKEIKTTQLRNPLVLYDGVKSQSAWNFDDLRGWKNLSGDDERRGPDMYYQKVAWLFRAVQDRSIAVGSMPFVIMEGDSEFDSSNNYKNKLKFLQTPSKLFRLIEMSLCMSGKAYCILETNSSGYVKNIRYAKPTSIKENYNETTGELISYTRTLNKNKTKELPVANVLAIYNPDYLVEIGPGETSPATAALASAGVLYSTDMFIAQFFDRGAIKATVLSTVNTSKSESERLQHWWDDVVGGIKNAWAAIVLRGELTKPTIIGEGIESLSNENLTTERRQNIAAAIGVPESRMWSSAANYSTRLEDEKAYYSGTIIPECELIAECFNTDLFNTDHQLEGYHISFQSEELSIFQDDESERAKSLQLLVVSGTPLLLAMDILGYDLSQEERSMLEAAIAEKERKAEEIAAGMQEKQDQEDNGGQNGQVQEQQQGKDPQAVRSALYHWKTAALTAVKTGHAANVDFDNPAIPEHIAESIRYELEGCQDANKVHEVFKMARDWMKQDEPVDIAVELKRANDLLEKVYQNAASQG
jgi:HK97 family phage portal protein